MNNIVDTLIKHGHIKLNFDQEFVFTSGIKSPIYCNMRECLSNTILRDTIVDTLIRKLEAQGIAYDGVAGVSTAGIPWGAWVAGKTAKSFSYVRDTPKEHGIPTYVEGGVIKNGNYIVVEDLISTGKSATTAAKRIEEAGGRVVAIASVFNYQLNDDLGYPTLSVCDFNDLLDHMPNIKLTEWHQRQKIKKPQDMKAIVNNMEFAARYIDENKKIIGLFNQLDDDYEQFHGEYEVDDEGNIKEGGSLFSDEPMIIGKIER